MTITHFSTLSLPNQIELLYTEGVHLAKRNCDGMPIILYQFGKWYAEIFYEKYRSDVSYIKCVDDTGVLDLYLEELEIENVFR
ncbi:MAG: hypothetical protein J7497_06190 [Chitinophagaceae bacterium]|nr:hypothetical protein [Chitinophagaceae bacterium]